MQFVQESLHKLYMSLGQKLKKSLVFKAIDFFFQTKHMYIGLYYLIKIEQSQIHIKKIAFWG